MNIIRTQALDIIIMVFKHINNEKVIHNDELAYFKYTFTVFCVILSNSIAINIINMENIGAPRNPKCE